MFKTIKKVTRSSSTFVYFAKPGIISASEKIKFAPIYSVSWKFETVYQPPLDLLTLINESINNIVEKTGGTAQKWLKWLIGGTG